MNQYLRAGILIAIGLIASSNAYATCQAPANEPSVPCDGCNDLQQNPSIGHDLGWNAILDYPDLRLDLLARGWTRIHLTDPRFSSAGVLYYTFAIEDPTWTITNTNTHSQTFEQYNQYDTTLGFQGPIPTAQLHARYVARDSMTTNFGSSTSRGTAPYTSRLLDSEGNLISEISRNRSDPEQTPFIPNTSGIDPNNPPTTEYTRSECVDDDPRTSSNGDSSTSDTGGSSGGGDDSGDYWGGWGDGYGEDVGCWEDPDPYEGGVVCPTP